VTVSERQAICRLSLQRRQGAQPAFGDGAVPIGADDHHSSVTKADDDHPVVLVASRRRWLGLLAIGVVFTAGGALMVSDGRAAGWFAAIFFALCVVVSAAMVVRPSRLVIDGSGMTSYHLWRRDRFEFRECGPFSVWRNPIARSQTLVVFDWEGAGRHRRLARLSKGLSGATSALPETYGMPAEQLALLLNRSRDCSTGRR
jgi:hypothetical protein